MAVSSRQKYFRSELTESKRYPGTITNPGTPIDPETRLYAYDPIGNGRTATEGSVSTTYSGNSLNQYTSVSAASVVNPVHDDDGNVTDYKNMKYSWNAENQMISSEPKNPSEGDKKTEYLYDYMGRRARKQIYVYSSDGWTKTAEKLFVYDGWNLIKEITKTGGTSSDKYYVWGPDLSQSLQGAGGIGGLVCAVSAGEVRHYFYDANGNAGQVVNADGSIAAHYEYDPFGNIVNGVSPTDDNPFRFSTKYLDAETGLYYYGFRYYSAELGRWWSRDPIEEKGGLNLYSFNTNDTINLNDYLGLEVLAIVVKHPNGKWDTYIGLEGEIYGYITEAKYYRVPSTYRDGKTNMIVVDYHVTIFGLGNKTVLSEIIFRDKKSFFNTEKKNMFRKTLSLILAAGGPLAYMAKFDKAGKILDNAAFADTTFSIGEASYDSYKKKETEVSEWIKKGGWESLGYIPFVSVVKATIDLVWAAYESTSVEAFDTVNANGFDRPKVTQIIDLTCLIEREGVTYEKISEAIMKFHKYVTTE